MKSSFLSAESHLFFWFRHLCLYMKVVFTSSWLAHWRSGQSVPSIHGNPGSIPASSSVSWCATEYHIPWKSSYTLKSSGTCFTIKRRRRLQRMLGMVEGSGSSIGNSPGLAVRNALRPFFLSFHKLPVPNVLFSSMVVFKEAGHFLVSSLPSRERWMRVNSALMVFVLHQWSFKNHPCLYYIFFLIHS